MSGVLLDARARTDVRAKSLHVPFLRHSQATDHNCWISLDSHSWQVDASTVAPQRAPFRFQLQWIVRTNLVPRCFAQEGQTSRLDPFFSCHSLSIGFLHTRHVRWDRHTATARDTTRGRSRRKSGHVAVRGRKEGTRGPASAPGLHRHRRCTCVTRLAYETTCSEGKCSCACLACGARSTCVQTRSTPTGSNAASVECRSRACERLGTRRTYETNAWVEWNHSSEMVRASKTCCE